MGPIGVTYGIQPWTYSAYQFIQYSIANLMAGSGFLFKHVENVTGSGKMLEEIYSVAGLLECLFAVLVVGYDISVIVTQHKHVRGIILTCSTKSGRIYNNGETCIAVKRFIVAGQFMTNFTSSSSRQCK
jgi:succinate-semialdehyde dehydrogenase / glutarate-semialdehyde dehydrogenase